MALKSTNDRYKYIYGNTARKTEAKPEDMHSTSPRKTHPQDPLYRPQKPQAGRKASDRVRLVKPSDAFDWKFLFMSALALFFIAVAALFYVKEASRLSKLSDQIVELKEEKAELQSRQASIQSELDKAINLDEIREYAEDELGMVYPDHEDVIYYYQDSSDYFRQYESVDK